MTSAHRYPPPPPNSQSDFRLPSLKDLNFYRPSGPQPPNPPSHQQDLAAVQPDSVQQPARHPAAWSRQTYHPPQQPAHQQYAPANHEVSPKVEYAPKHENSAYAHPAVPPSAHPNSAAMPPPQRSEDASHTPNQTKRHRTAPSAASRDTRPSHPSVYSHPQYPPPYPQPSQPPSASQYQSLPQGPPPAPSHAPHPASSSHDHRQQSLHSMPVTAHPAYAYPAYVQPRQTLLHPNSTQVSHHNQSTPYPSSAPPAHAPPPQPPWPQSQQPPAQFQQQPPPTQQHPHQGHAPSHHHHQQQQHQPQPSMPASSNQPIPSHHHHQQPPPPPPPPTSAPSTNPPPSQQIPPSVQYHPQHQQYQNHYPHPSQQPQPQTPASFVRPTAVNPTTLETRSTYPVAEPPRVPSVQNDAMSEITAHCNILYSFANQYVSLQHTNPHAQPPPAELEEMSQRALKVVRLLDDFRRICIPEGTQMLLSPTGSTLVSNSVPPLPADSPEPGESSRPPKRPWEDTQEEGVPASDSVGTQEQFPANPSPDPKTQTTAEQDMELIRTKRATSTAIANGSSGQPKSKYRKRSMGQRASPPGKCHSCNIRETPEWRRGPDGARTLCNACGLHYAKLMRKQNKAAGTGDAQHIDLETLRASTRAADAGEKGRNPSKQTESSSSSSKTNNKNQQNSSDTNPEASTSGRPGTTPPTPSQTAHQGSFQLVAVMAPPQDHHPVHPNHAPIPSSSSTAPTPMQVDSRPASQHASTPQMQTMHPPPPPPPPSAPSHHSQPHPQHPPHPPWPTTAATTGAAAAASGAVSGTPAGSMRGGTAGGGGSASGSSAPSFGNPPSQSPVDFMRRQYSIPNRTGNQQQHQPANR